MLTKRIIPCLDIKNGRAVKGVRFQNIVDAGDPIELAARYVQEGADEIVFLDIAATEENRGTFVDLVQKLASVMSIPFTVGGGIRNVSDAHALLNAGADKISINSIAIRQPNLIGELASLFGRQFVVVAVDSKRIRQTDIVHIQGGKILTDRTTDRWIAEVVQRGAGEILLTSMDRDGTGSGFDIELIRRLQNDLKVPLIASGGAGTLEDFAHVFEKGVADAALAAGVFHRNEIPIPELKNYLAGRNIPIRI